MDNILSTGLSSFSTVPEKFVLPPDKRQGIHAEKIDIPIIDLHQDQKNSVQQIINACRDFGLFQVINHGISSGLMDDAMRNFTEIFAMPPEERSKINMKEDLNKICQYYTSSYNYDIEEFHYWREILRHSCNPLEECVKFWPQNPKTYREIVGAYVTSLKELGMWVLELIAQGLGLEQGFFASDELTTDDILTVNHYPPCPDPSVTIGLPKHKDPTLINMVQPYPVDVPGLQLLKDGQWFGFQTAPNAILVFVGNQLEVISNGELKAVVHRVVTNAIKARTTAVFFISPSMECIIEPAKALLQAKHSTSLYRSFKYKEYFDIHVGQDVDRSSILENYNFKISS